MLGVGMRCVQIVKATGVLLFLGWIAGFPFALEHIVTNTPLHLLVGGREYLSFVDYLPLVGVALYGIGHIVEGGRCNAHQKHPLG